MVKDRNSFLTRMENLKLYLVKLEKNNKMKSKICPSDCAIEGDDHCLIILITHNECIFSANNKI